MMKVLGLTGGIATGKSTVSNHLRQQGRLIIDADQVARDIVRPGTVGLSQVVKAFGKNILTDNGELDRGRLAKLVFSSKKARQQLNDILQPLIRQQIVTMLDKYRQQQVPLVVLDAPLLIEEHYQPLCDYIMVVTTKRSVQLARLMQRNQLTSLQAQQRIDSQLALTEKIKQADVVIDNNGTMDETWQQVDRWLASVMET